MPGNSKLVDLPMGGNQHVQSVLLVIALIQVLAVLPFELVVVDEVAKNNQRNYLYTRFELTA